MKIDNIDIHATLEKAKAELEKEESISSSFKTLLNVLFVVIGLLLNRLTLNSKNSSKPPSSDPNRKKKQKKKSTNPRGGQNNHIGTTLKPVENPDEIIDLPIDKRTLPRGGNYREAGYDARQVIHLRISRHVIEYRAQIVENEQGQQWRAAFPEQVTRPAQYGSDVKSHAVYQSQYQLLPYNRIENYFRHEALIPLSQGSLYRFNQEAYQQLARFETWVKIKLIQSNLAHADETGININATLHWLHAVVNEKYTHFYPHTRRGNEATQTIGILPYFKGTLCHDHWKPYFYYECRHSLCNAHHLRELERAFEQDKQQWAKSMQLLLLEMNQMTQAYEGKVSEGLLDEYYRRYQSILSEAEKECPAPIPEKEGATKKRGRIKKSRARNLLERLMNFQKETLRFMEELDVPFSNNLAERHIRMTKVHQKISGCFRSMEGAYIFCRIRSYLSTCQKNNVTATEALTTLFDGKIPQFIQDEDWHKIPEKPGLKDNSLLSAAE